MKIFCKKCDSEIDSELGYHKYCVHCGCILDNKDVTLYHIHKLQKILDIIDPGHRIFVKRPEDNMLDVIDNAYNDLQRLGPEAYKYKAKLAALISKGENLVSVIDGARKVNTQDIEIQNNKGADLEHDLDKYQKEVEVFVETIFRMNEDKEISVADFKEQSVHELPTKGLVTDNLPRFLLSKKFWIFIGLIFLVYLGYRFGVESNKPWTKADEREAVSECGKWGGKVVRNNDGKYIGCSINGRIDE